MKIYKSVTFWEDLPDFEKITRLVDPDIDTYIMDLKDDHVDIYLEVSGLSIFVNTKYKTRRKKYKIELKYAVNKENKVIFPLFDYSNEDEFTLI